jgi:hypothetical protein
MPKHILEELYLADNWERETYSLYEELLEERNKKQEGLVYLFREWLDLVSPADFGNDEGLEGILV